MISFLIFLYLRCRLRDMSKRNPNFVLAVIVALITITSIFVVIISSNRSTLEFDANSPQAVTQSYLVAIFDEDFDQAAQYFEATSECDASNLDKAYFDKNARINLLEADITDNRARVKVMIEYSNSDLFNNYYSEETVFRLLKEDDSWTLTGIPWPLYECTISTQ
jgi:hypothetical protein